MAKNLIKVKSYTDVHDDKVAAAGITPGMLVERTSADKVQAHSAAGGPVNKLFALEDAYQGKDITQAYVADDRVPLWHPTPGDIVYAIADDTTGVAISIGDFVESAGDGRLRSVTANSADTYANIVGVALEAATNGTRFMVEIS